MAGLILRRRPYLNLSRIFKSRPKTTYVVLLPETPLDTAEDNALLRIEDLPQFDQLTPDKCWSGIGKLALEFESGVWAVEEKAKTEEASFSNIIEELDRLESPLNVSWGTVKTLFLVKNNEMTEDIYMKIHERARKARSRKFTSLSIYEACKNIYTNDSNLDEAQRRVLRKFILEARLNGIELNQEKTETMEITLRNLEENKSLFKKKIVESTNRFSYLIQDPDIVKEYPKEILEKMAYNKSHQRGPWQVTLQPDVYEGTLNYCPSTEIRRNTYRAYNMRASNHISKDVNNSLHLEEIRSLRADQAKLLGYDNFAQMSMETKMAGSVDNVLSMITSIHNKARKSQVEEISSLQEFAEKRGFNLKLEAWDIPYWRRKQKRTLYNFDESQLQEYFPFDHVLEVLLELCSELFGVAFYEASNGVVPTWHPDVRFFQVLDSDEKHLASFYLDPFKRLGEKVYSDSSAWMVGCRSRSDIAGNIPLANLVFNFTPSVSEDKPALLAFSEVNLLFQKFGHALQHLLTTVPYSEASGLTNIEWDAIEVCSHFLQNWLYEPSVLERVSSHYESGLSLSGSSIQDIISGRNHMVSYDLCSELYLAHLDMQLYTSKDYWLDICRELWANYRPFVLDKYDSHLSSNPTFIANIWAAAYYSHLWSRMVAADAFQAFKESDDPTETGVRFKETFLHLGGGCHPGEVFRRFRGRDPSPDALQALHGLNKHK